jgi:hypothetical protein
MARVFDRDLVFRIGPIKGAWRRTAGNRIERRSVATLDLLGPAYFFPKVQS